ncbi:MAG TPA: DUF4395 domain-containing protein [Gaiellaceae bacterium]|nr:DUF4395 domain-containing protein [Gaiellaceae bacterium]
MKRLADPYRDLDVIDSRAPRFNQATIGLLAVLAVATGWWWLLGILGLQLVVGLTLGRRFCLPCLAYFELVQPRFGEGTLEDARPPRFANFVGAVFLTSATVAYAGRPHRPRCSPRRARRGPGAARGGNRLLHRLRGVQGGLLPARAAVRVLPAAAATRLTFRTLQS